MTATSEVRSQKSEVRTRLIVECVLGALALGLGIWLVIQNAVPGGMFVAERSIEEHSAWIKNFWPPTSVHLLEKDRDGRWQQRIVVSPVTIRVRTPRTFSNVEIFLDADGIPGGSTVGIERSRGSGEYLMRDLVASTAMLSLSDVNQQNRDLQFQFVFPGQLRTQPVVVRRLRFTFSTKPL